MLEATISAELNYDNGCVDVYLVPDDATATDTTAYVGNFVLSRLCSKDNYRTQVQVVTFALTGTLPKGSVFHDCTIEHGYTYRYALQQYNSYGIYSSRVYSQDVFAAFEDAFLFDGDRQLRIRFNPKIASFKTVIQDSKKNTLGSKYPFFFRNGTVEYKEFSIGGLISYYMDENEFFLSYEEDLGMDPYHGFTIDIVDDNIAYERKFKLSVLDWLNDGKIKLFRSPGEGNYLVRLSNVSLSPNDTTSRMIHSFTCTADEIADFNAANLLKYDFLHVSENNTLELRFGTINFDKQIETLIGIIQGDSDTSKASEETVNTALAQFQAANLLDGRMSQYIKLDECTPRTWFTLDGIDYIVGATGTYEVTMPSKDDAFTALYIKEPYRHMPGSLTYGIWTTKSSIFDVVTDIQQTDVFDCPKSSSVNYMTTVQDTKNIIKNILFMKFTLNDLVYEISTLEDWQEAYNFYLEETGPTSPKVYNVIFTSTEDVIDTQTRERQIIGTRDYKDLFIDSALFYCLSNDTYYQYDITQNTLTELVNTNPVVYTKDYPNGYRLKNTQICIDDEIIDVEERNYFNVPTTNHIPSQLYWGQSVTAVLAYQLLTLVYGVESNKEPALGQKQSLVNLWKQYQTAARDYQAQRLQYVELSSSVSGAVASKIVSESNNPKSSYYIWNDVTLHFERLTIEQQSGFTGSKVWMPYPYSLYLEHPAWNGASITKNNFTYKQYTCTEANYQNKKSQYFTALDAVLALEELEVVIN